MRSSSDLIARHPGATFQRGLCCVGAAPAGAPAARLASSVGAERACPGPRDSTGAGSFDDDARSHVG